MEIKAKDYDLIGYRIVSPFHLMALAAFALNFRPDKERLRVLIIVSDGPWGKTIISDTPLSDPRLDVTYVEESQSGFKSPPWWPVLLLLRVFASVLLLWKRQTKIPVCAPSLACLRFSTSTLAGVFHLQPTLIDEGVGSFNTAQNFKRDARKKFRNPFVQWCLSGIYGVIFSAFRFLGGRRVTLFEFQDHKPVVNERVANSYRRAFQSGYLARNTEISLKESALVILTQPFVELGVCSLNDYMTEMGKLVRKAHKSNLMPLLKVHPAEDQSKYAELGVEILEYRGPAEEVFAAAADSIAEIWGFTSTSLITGSVLYGIRSCRVHLPWPDASLDFFQDESRSLFLTYTEPLQE